MGLFQAIGLLIRAGVIATIGLVKVAALKMALPLLRLAGRVEGVARHAEETAVEYEKKLAEERSHQL
ncbi:MAG TPA: hypothetical protein VJT67_11885 [Longimicrobiaceae bacterium]|nr:hypothetical protein [Longimicrobiaceae bacterium]